ncbi:MAG: tetratricopeptide repeat protein [Bacteroidota bacterium]
MKSQLILSSFILLVSTSTLIAQNNKELARQRAMDAIELIDQGKYKKSIKLLREAETLDKTEYTYPYEIALAYAYDKQYDKAIAELEKILSYEGINSQVYQLLGNCYSYTGNREKAIAVYDAGIEQFPNAGRLFLEKGNVYHFQKEYDAAIQNYEMGIKKDPNFPSNYCNAARLLLSSSDKVTGLIYGEIFMNLERTTSRTQEMSELLFNTYQESISIMGDSMSIDFCEPVLIVDPKSFDIDKLPLCLVFGKHFILALSLSLAEEINLSTLSAIRTRFVELYYETDSESYPNVLFAYQKTMLDEGLLDTYNHYLFQMANQEAFAKWRSENEEKFQAFVQWYTTEENILNITEENVFLRN